MKKEDKKVVIETLTEQVNSYKHLYVSDISGLDAVDTQALRRACFDANIKHIVEKGFGKRYQQLRGNFFCVERR